MNLALLIFICLNLIVIVSYLVGQNFIFEKSRAPKVVAYYALHLAVLLVIYLILISVLVIVATFRQNFLFAPLLISLVLTFLVGRMVTYPKLKLYTNLQLLSLFFSLFYTLFLLVKAY